VIENFLAGKRLRLKKCKKKVDYRTLLGVSPFGSAPAAMASPGWDNTVLPVSENENFQRVMI
jgi:hypothetical protein